MNLPVPEGMERKRFLLLLSVIGVCGLLTLKGVAESLLSDNSAAPPPAQGATVTKITENAPLPSPSSNKGEDVAPKKEQVNLSSQMAALSQKNPFVDPSTLPKQARDMHAALPTIPQTAPAPVGDVPVPAVPRQPVLPPAGAVGGNTPAGVQGVLTGGRGGNMAIMSDGTVVSEGDTYQDQRIAYIGGDGITFDNGHHLDYK